MKRNMKKFIDDINFINAAIIKNSKKHDELVRELEKKRKTKIITLCLNSDINNNLVTTLYRKCFQKMLENPCEKLEVIVDSVGGYADPTYQLIKLLRKSCKKELNFIVPRYAKSAATFLVLGGDKLFLTDIAELGPLDIQMSIAGKEGTFTPASLDPTFDKVHELILKDQDELAKMLVDKLITFSIGHVINAEKIMRAYLPQILKERMFKNLPEKTQEIKINKITETLVAGYTHHERVVDIDELKTLGIKVMKLNKSEEKIVWEIYDIQKRINFYNELASNLRIRAARLDPELFFVNEDPVLRTERERKKTKPKNKNGGKNKKKKK